MANLSSLKNDAEAVANSSDPDVKQLAKVVYELCRYVAEVENKAKHAEDTALRATSDARGKK